jgi:dihydroorotase
MFGGEKHKDHKFLRLGEVYDKHCDVIKKEATGLKKRLKELTKYTTDVQITIEKVTRAKEDKCKEIENFVENIQAKLNT